MPYQPIANYGIIGDMRTVALVGMHGSIDWLCFPHFDSPSIFAAILDDQKGGRYSIAPTPDGVTSKQIYWPETNILVTRFLSPDGIGEVIDYMPVGLEDDQHRQLIRTVKVVHGTMTFELRCQPAFDYARAAHTVELTDNGAIFSSQSLRLGLAAHVPLREQAGGVEAEFTLRDGETISFVLKEVTPDESCGPELSNAEADHLFQHTVTYWQKWLSQCTYKGRWRETIYRSALALKLMTFEPTGAIVAAPTCSLPEYIGGERNWDYRFTWMRDAAFTVYALMRIGFTKEAARFIEWLEARCRESKDGQLGVLYRIDGSQNLEETTLDHLDGYQGSKPVRIGNDAHGQLQLDIYGEVLDSVYLYNKHGTPISYDLWVHLRRMVNWVCDNWRRNDSGVWEARSGPQQYVYSKLMCWVALDRALRLADKRSFPADRERWLAERDAVYEEIMSEGWNEERQAFVQSYGSDALDASTLLMPLVFFSSPTDPRMLKTLDALMRPPEQGGLVTDSLVYRYNLEETQDGLGCPEGTFNMCTFWLVEALTRAGRVDQAKLDEARLIFEEMLSYSNHLGLYAEETGMNGEALGNFPQAFTHLALISAAFNLDRALGTH